MAKSTDATIDNLRKALAVSPDNLPLRLALASAYQDRGKAEEAVVEYEAVLVIEPDNLDAIKGLGLALYRLGDMARAATVLDGAPGGEDDPELLHTKARVLLASGEGNKALDLYRRAQQGNPHLVDEELEGRFDQHRAKVELGPPGGEIGVEPTDFIERTSQKITFADVGGLEDLKEEISLTIIKPFQHPEIYAAYGRKVGGGILLFGPPGCGKTYIARATAGECEATFVNVAISDVLDMWMGQSEKNIVKIFDVARKNKPAVVFFDEIDALGGKRSHHTHMQHYRMCVDQFLGELDGFESSNEGILILGATNTPWYVDQAFRRPGRFDRIVFVPPPDRVTREQILRLHLRGKPLADDIDFAALARKSHRFSGADLKALCEMAADRAIRDALKDGKVRPITHADLADCLKRIRPTTDEWLETANNYALYSNVGGFYDGVMKYLDRKDD